jgi:hypothetical protein
MDLSEERAARNEALFREVNEQVESLADGEGAETKFLCECSDDRCTERLDVPRAVYEAVRAHPRRFLVLPGHADDFEHVVEHAAGYAVVEKEGRAGEIAEQTDPRR